MRVELNIVDLRDDDLEGPYDDQFLQQRTTPLHGKLGAVRPMESSSDKVKYPLRVPRSASNRRKSRKNMRVHNERAQTADAATRRSTRGRGRARTQDRIQARMVRDSSASTRSNSPEGERTTESEAQAGPCIGGSGHNFTAFLTPRAAICSQCHSFVQKCTQLHGCQNCEVNLCLSCHPPELSAAQLHTASDAQPQELSAAQVKQKDLRFAGGGTESIASTAVPESPTKPSSLQGDVADAEQDHICPRDEEESLLDYLPIMPIRSEPVSRHGGVNGRLVPEPVPVSISVGVKTCRLCHGDHKGFGDMCAMCRKNPYGAVQQCSVCHQYFTGYSGVCEECS